jgi:hypothetical protein
MTPGMDRQDAIHAQLAVPQVAKFGANIMYAKPTPGVLEIEPSMAWNPAVLAGGRAAGGLRVEGWVKTGPNQLQEQGCRGLSCMR